MTWPWVSRERYDDYVRAHHMLGEELRHQRDALDHERARYAELLEKYHALASPAVPDATGHADLAPRAPKPASIVTQAIKDESGGDPRLAGFLRKRAAELRREGKTPDEVAQQLRTWQTTEEEPAV